ncbi:hypothetical protein [Algibacter pacificus]|uniref:hypothetical protein n=1 Tax=Algibacter pacificus TaxID=2599389 RepID=UPI0011C91994|nr:hypothetical protein [Algibacter pacificus]
MNTFKYKIAFFLCSSMFIFSCTKSIDFNQVEDLEVTPEFEASFIHFNEPASRFLANGVEVSTSQDFIDIEFFRYQFTSNHLKRVELVFETQNTINRAFAFTIDFIDITNTVVHSFTVQENASADHTDTVSTYTEVFENEDLLALKQTVRIAYTLRLRNGTPIDTDSLGRVACKSYAAFQINLVD